MRVRWGNYTHRIAEANLTIQRTPILNAAQVPILVEELWSWTGKLYNRTGTPAGMDALLRDFERAYTVNGKDLTLEYEDGRRGYHQLLNRDCIGGTVVVKIPEFPQSGPGEMATIRSYSVAVKGVRPIVTGASLFLEFRESLSIRGGGARWGCREVNFGPGVRHRLRTHTTCFATQSGSATLYLGNPQVPPPIWPYALVDELPDLDLNGPTPEAGALVKKTISWTYNFQATSRLFGVPHYLLG